MQLECKNVLDEAKAEVASSNPDCMCHEINTAARGKMSLAHKGTQIHRRLCARTEARTRANICQRVPDAGQHITQPSSFWK